MARLSRRVAAVELNVGPAMTPAAEAEFRAAIAAALDEVAGTCTSLAGAEDMARTIAAGIATASGTYVFDRAVERITAEQGPQDPEDVARRRAGVQTCRGRYDLTAVV